MSTLFTIGSFICRWVVYIIWIAVILLASRESQAQERYSDVDKKLHFAAGATIAAGVTVWTKSAPTGAMAGCAVGVAKESYDKANPSRHSATAKDAIATCLGAAVGAGTGWVITKDAVLFEFKF